MRIAPSSERTLRLRQYQLHEEHGRTFEWPTSAKPGTCRPPCEVQVPLRANLTADARSESLLRTAYPNSSCSPSVVAQSTNCGGSVMPFEEFAAFITASCCRSWSRSRDVERSHCGIWTEAGPSALANHRAHCRPLVTAVGGSRERERGCFRRWSDQPSRPRLRRRQASPCRRARCCPRLSWPPCTRSLGCRSRWRSSACARRSGSTVVERTSCACWPRWRRQRGM